MHSMAHDAPRNTEGFPAEDALIDSSLLPKEVPIASSGVLRNLLRWKYAFVLAGSLSLIGGYQGCRLHIARGRLDGALDRAERQEPGWQTPASFGTGIGLMQSYDAHMEAGAIQRRFPVGTSAVQGCIRMVEEGRKAGENRIFAVLMTQLGINLTAKHVLEHGLANGDARSESLAALQHLLEMEAERPLPLMILRQVRAGSFRQLMRWKVGEIQIRNMVPRSSVSSLLSQIPNGKAHNLYLGMRAGLADNNLSAFVSVSSEFVTIAMTPPSTQRMDAWKAAVATIPRQSWLARPFLDDLARHFANTGHEMNGVRSAVAAIAAERFRLAHGRWPDSWEELVPQLLSKVPEDFLAGAPLFLRRLPDGLIIYPSGPDGTDDGEDFVIGRTAAPPKQGFRLWDPAHRGKQSGSDALKSFGRKSQ
ncbi:MAG: Uncharacterized protein Greene041619_802 [Candidatus Peregrinibacteria bacterium Greene0416_19]|nr:MAG: Uncharacterized protein Greene041619_802 [Candidatus Peregrinibacteria bacterium Greene0416_19]